MGTLSFEELRERADESWTTDGPSSDGVEGWFLYAQQLYRYRSDWQGVSVSPGMTVAEFCRFHANSDNPRIRAILDYLGRGQA